MTKHNAEIEAVIFQALSHPMRRTIIKILETNTKGTSYTELITELGLSTGKMNYHIEQLEGLIEKNEEHRYVLTPLGKKALNQLKQLKYEVTDEDEKYLRIAEKTQKTSLEPTVKSFIIIGIIASSVVIFILASLAYIAITQGGVPTLVYLLLPLLIAIEVSVVATLIHALRKTPAWLRRLERRFLGSA
jgi:predicted transcriptional regulator